MSKATAAQISLIKHLGRELGCTVEGDAKNSSHVLNYSNRSHWASLRVYEASALISRLQNETDSRFADRAEWIENETARLQIRVMRIATSYSPV